MLIVQFLGKHNEVLKEIEPPPLCVTIGIYEINSREEIREHFPNRNAFPHWTGKTKKPPESVC